ncbi:hypothetical protein C5749_03870 [Sphingobacterium gobiense]|uniref:N-formylglutamate amidohydrolase n=2 Tax=Sphingobacterium gobiense TaxID=1382456 RepID=A0A2S9JT26_9SPHI|nr:hypothetical protein C5749_03870 [Sphingobacterium gobiense]
MLLLSKERTTMTSFFQYSVHLADSPFWAFAVHDGHQIDPTVEHFMLLDETQRLREEDPYTASMAELPINQLFVGSSRFQLDVNRKEEDSVYLRPEQAWGLEVWKDTLPSTILQQLYDDYKNFYKQVDSYIQHTIDKHHFFVVLDVHSYNAQRINEKQPIDKHANPQINLGTRYNTEKWRPVIDRFMESVRSQRLLDEAIDIRENVKFKGGYLAQHILDKFGDQGCVLSIEFRKDFMNEWTGLPYQPVILEYKQLLLYTLKDLQKLDIYGV